MKNFRMVLFPLTILVAVVLRNNMVDAVDPPGGALLPAPSLSDFGGAPGFGNAANGLTPGADPSGVPDANANVDADTDSNFDTAVGAGAKGNPTDAEEASGGRGFPPILRNLLRALQKVQKKYKRS